MHNNIEKINIDIDNIASLKNIFKRKEIKSTIDIELEKIDNDLSKIPTLISDLDLLNSEKDSLEDKFNNYQEKTTIKINELEVKQKLISKLLSEKSNSEGLVQFREAFYKNFLDFANKEDSIVNEAEMILKLQDIEKELELISSYPSLHTKMVVAVGGGFSSGKSEFISSFMQSNIRLPIGVVPTTAIPTYVLHKESDEFIACNHKGGAINIEKIDKDFHSKLSHDFIKSFDFNLKEIMPFMILATKIKYENICFVDTPGYNPADTDDGFTSEDIKTAKEFLDNSNSFLWLIGADANGTISSNDLEFLDSLNLENKRVYIILNKADLRPLDDIENILEEIGDSLEDYGIEVEGISAYSSITKKEYEYINKPLHEFLESYDNETEKHDEIIIKLSEIYKTYKFSILKSIKEKESVISQLQSISLDITEDSIDISNDAFQRIGNLKRFFSIKDKKTNLKLLDESIVLLQNSIDTVFDRKSKLRIEDIQIDNSEVDILNY